MLSGETVGPDAQQFLEVLLDQTIERGLFGPSRLVDPAADLHARPEAGGRGTGGKGRRASGPRPPTTAQVYAVERPGKVRERSAFRLGAASSPASTPRASPRAASGRSPRATCARSTLPGRSARRSGSGRSATSPECTSSSFPSTTSPTPTPGPGTCSPTSRWSPSRAGGAGSPCSRGGGPARADDRDRGVGGVGPRARARRPASAPGAGSVGSHAEAQAQSSSLYSLSMIMASSGPFQ